MNKKGFAVSGMIYAILVLFLILVFSILSILGSRKLTFDKLKKDVLTHLNDSVSSSVLNFSYSGKIQTVTLKPGVYKLEAWGAQGGNIGSYIGGYGGYSQGEITLIEETTLYIGVGGEGTNSDAGGFNGGGSLTSGQSSFGASGGGATHISTINKTLPLLENDKDSILIVAGGGGGANYRGEGYGEGNGGSGGGFTGSNGNSVNHTNGYGYGYGYGGTQSSGGSRFWESSEEEDNTKPGVFGQGGGTEVGSTTQSGGGGGYYGGGASGHGGAGGGSGYIGNPLLTNKIMYCYNCSEQNEGKTRTKSTGDVSDKPIEGYAKQGNGFAKITKVSNVNEPNKPELLDNMVPIKYENEKWLVADTNQKWYDYNNKEWANAVILRSSINNSNLYDLSGNGNNGVLENGATITDEGVYFNGAKQGVGIKSTTSVDLGTNFTFAARVKVENNNNAENDIIANWEGAGYGLASTKDGSFAFSVYDSKTSKYITVKTKTTYPVGSWHIVVGTYDGTTLKIYVDGVLSNSLSTTLTPKVSSTMFALGANPSGTTYTSGEDFNGTISDALVIKTTLSADTISKYYGTKFNYQENDKTLFYFSMSNKKLVGTEINESDIALWYVWVPRYKYTIFNGNNGSVSEQLINVTFETDINKTGTVSCVNNTDGSETCTDNTYGSIINGTSTYTHPAFTFGNKELTGFWVGKFEVSTTDSTCNKSTTSANCNKVLTMTIKPNVSSWRYSTISNHFTSIQNATGTYGISNADSHMMKNMEWGAVAYLKQSKYGLGTIDIAVNTNSNFYTGGGTSDAYKTNVAQSTTGNVYGVYDMAGGAWERVMGNMKNSSNVFYSSSAGFATAPDAKYYDSYKYDSSNNKTHARGKLGDATKETLATFGNTSGGWYKDLANFPYSSGTWFSRGGGYGDGNGAGMFLFYYTSGGASNFDSSRAILTKTD